MFFPARVKLTLWYLGIVMVITLLFSGFIYQMVARELERSFAKAHMRMQGMMLNDLERGMLLPPEVRAQLLERIPSIQDDLQNTKHKLIIVLALVNGIIWVIAAGSSYFLAGATLRPIARAIAKQKEFVTHASHELRTPITALRTALEVNLGDKKVGKYEKRLLQDNLEDVVRLEGLSERLLRLTILDSDSGHVRSKKVVLVTVFERVVKLFDKKAKKHGIKLVVKKVPANLRLSTDPELLFELLGILVDNAIKYTKKGGSVSLHARVSKKKVTIVVADTGTGIAEKHLKKIFERFYQVDAARLKKVVQFRDTEPAGHNGYGLGLAIAKRLVEELGGIITVESEVKKGSRFEVVLSNRD